MADAPESSEDRPEKAGEEGSEAPVLNKAGNRRGMHNAGKEWGERASGSQPKPKKPVWHPSLGPPEPPDLLSDLKWVIEHYTERLDGEPSRLAVYRGLTEKELVDRVMALEKRAVEERAAEQGEVGEQAARAEEAIEALLSRGEGEGWPKE